jgi:hypothetical protein
MAELDKTWATLCRLQDALALATIRAKSFADYARRASEGPCLRLQSWRFGSRSTHVASPIRGQAAPHSREVCDGQESC